MAKNQKNQQGLTLDMSSEEVASKKKLAANPFGSMDQVELRSSEIEEGLSEIYQDEEGKIVNMKEAEIIHGHSWLYRLFIWLFNLTLVAIISWAGYYYLNQYRSSSDTDSLQFSLEAPKKIVAGGELVYVVSYKNFDRIDLREASIKLVYPSGFIFGSAEPAPSEGQDFWRIGDIGKLRSGEIKIKGRLVDEVGKGKIALASLAYTPANFSSEFKKDASAETIVESINIDFSFDFPGTVLLEDQNDLYITYHQQDGAMLENFRLTVGQLENLSFNGTSSRPENGIYKVALNSSSSVSDNKLSAGKASSAAPVISMGSQGELRIPLVFLKKINDKETLNLNFEYSADGENYYSFFKKELAVEVLSKSINLDLLINGSKDSQGIDFGQTLNYTVGFANKGEQSLRNLVIVAVLDSEFLDWSSLKDQNRGKSAAGKIVWTQAEVPALANLGPGQEGTIDFSVNVASAGEINPVKNYQVRSYARYSIGLIASSSEEASSSIQAFASSSESSKQSNIIISKVNSNLGLSEELRYFDNDNIAVGSGPQPPRVGQKTGYRVYWQLTNSLNELNNLKIETILPDYVEFDGRELADAGTVGFNQETRKVVWDIGKLKINNTEASAQFNVAFVPTSTDINKILVILQGTTVSADDAATKNKINKKSNPKTSRLDDDSAIVDDGRVVE